MREDLELQSEAESRGWVAEKHVYDRDREGVPQFPLQFRKNDTFLWFCGHCWVCAECTATQYVNHREYTTLELALDNEI